MAPPPKKLVLNREDMPDAPEWWGKVLESLNPFGQATSQALSNGLTFAENFACEVKTVVFMAPYPVWRTGLSGTWVDFGGSDEVHGYRIDESGRVWTKGLVKNGAAAPSTILQVPLGYAPEDRHIFVVPTSGAVKGEVHALGSGVVSLDAGNVGYVSLAGLSWQAGNPVAPDAPGAPWPLVVTHSLPFVAEVQVMRTRCLDLAAGSLRGAPQFEWDAGGESNLFLRNVYGLVAGRKYEVTLRLVAG